MTTAIMMRAFGGPDVLVPEHLEVGEPGAGEIRIRQTAIGVNYHDMYVRTGAYRTLDLPGVPGIEAVGVVEAIGDGVSDITTGDRIGYITNRYGAYAGVRIFPASHVVKLPETLDDIAAATLLLKGLTAQMLARQVAPVSAGKTVLVHAAAGGVGRLLAQWCAHLGATVIGTVGSAAKAQIATAAGCAHTILYRETDVAAAVGEITAGRGVDVAFDAVGASTFAGSFASLGLRGHLVNYGQASGPVPAVEMSLLATKSASISRPIIFHYTQDPAMLRAMAKEVFDLVAEGVLAIEPGAVMPLAEAGAAHALLESREATGPVVLVPEEAA
jgi:NADPH2:quinone reductase